MRFEPGKFYSHEGGRQIAVHGPIETYKWGSCFVIEEADKTGHGISISEVDQAESDHEWVEIGKEEWLENFKDSVCDECGKVFQGGDKFVTIDNQMLHVECFAERVKERENGEVIQPD